MKTVGIMLVVVGLALGSYALLMDVGVNIPAQDLGDGSRTPAMHPAIAELLSDRENYMLSSGMLIVVGALLIGFDVKK